MVDAVRQQFARKVRTLMHDKGWNQSELARRAELGRDNVSGYVRGRNLPNSQHLNKLARALNVEPSTLMGSAAYQERFPAAEDQSILRMEQLADDPSKVLLHVQQRVTLEQAQEILSVLQKKHIAQNR